MLAGLEQLCPLSAPLTDQPMLELFFGVILPALGSAILFNIEASTGGTDITAMILKKFTSLDIGMALLLSDVLIAGATLFIYDIRTGLFSLLGLALKSVLVDSVIESLNRKKSFMVVTTHPTRCAAISPRPSTGAPPTGRRPAPIPGVGCTVVLTALSRAQAIRLRKHLRGWTPTPLWSSPTPARSSARGSSGPDTSPRLFSDWKTPGRSGGRGHFFSG